LSHFSHYEREGTDQIMHLEIEIYYKHTRIEFEIHCVISYTRRQNLTGVHTLSIILTIFCVELNIRILDWYFAYLKYISFSICTREHARHYVNERLKRLIHHLIHCDARLATPYTVSALVSACLAPAARFELIL
jgi:hypothetical protein